MRRNDLDLLVWARAAGLADLCQPPAARPSSVGLWLPRSPVGPFPFGGAAGLLSRFAFGGAAGVWSRFPFGGAAGVRLRSGAGDSAARGCRLRCGGAAVWPRH